MDTTSSEPEFGKVAIIGIGLIGGSLGMAIRKRGLAREVIGIVRRPETIAEGIAAGAIDNGTLDAAAGVAGADLVVIATRLGLTRHWCEAIASSIGIHTIVTDVGSTKLTVVRDAVDALPHPSMFVGGHPIAGSEQQGVSSAREDLFNDAVYVLTPTSITDPSAASRMESLAKAIGSRVVTIDPRTHDRLLAMTSHLPHVMASCLAIAVGKEIAGEGVGETFVGTGLRDTTRIAAGPPEVWADIMVTNREEILRGLAGYLDAVAEFADALKEGDPKKITELLAEGKTVRDRWTL